MAPSLDEIRRLPGWRDLAAVKHDRLHVVSESIIHPSPRLVDALEQVAAVLHPDRMKGYSIADCRLPIADWSKLSVVSCQLSVAVGLRMTGDRLLTTDNGRLFKSSIVNRQSSICNRQFLGAGR